jgi:hypothetical protein
MDEPNGHRVREVELLAAPALGDHQARPFQEPEVLHHAETRHLEARRERTERLPVATEELVEQPTPGGVGQAPENVVHVPEYM